MIQIRKRNQRGHADHGWLKTYHTFSFASYQDPKHVHFRKLRVINEDYVAAGTGFDTHAHQDMEIITYVLAGALSHRDSMGNGSVIRPGEVQVMSAGTGVTHSEYNHEKDEQVHLLQIWIFPDQEGLRPSYQQKVFGPARQDRLCLVASRDGREGSLIIHQDAALYATVLSEKKMLHFAINPGRYVWLQLISGELGVNDHVLSAGDGMSVSEESALTLHAHAASEFLLFDLA